MGFNQQLQYAKQARIPEFGDHFGSPQGKSLLERYGTRHANPHVLQQLGGMPDTLHGM